MHKNDLATGHPLTSASGSKMDKTHLMSDLS